jgi:hypothetical protein
LLWSLFLQHGSFSFSTSIFPRYFSWRYIFGAKAAILHGYFGNMICSFCLNTFYGSRDIVLDVDCNISPELREAVWNCTYSISKTHTVTDIFFRLFFLFGQDDCTFSFLDIFSRRKNIFLLDW